YEEYGEDFVDMLDGMFSFVLLDTRDNSFLVAQDAIGITSLYIGWGLDDGTIPHGSREAIPSAPYDPIVLKHAFENDVIKRLMTDVPFGVLLSGGLDSTLVASIAACHLAHTKSAKQWGAQLHSFVLVGETYDVTTIRASTPMFLMSRKIKSLGVKMVISEEGSMMRYSGGYLYFHKAPNKEEFHHETCHKIKWDQGCIEKWVLRRAFDDEDHPLPAKGSA
ncbi:hypothetical protein IFM89_021805, partial [Coptis chinensis]